MPVQSDGFSYLRVLYDTTCHENRFPAQTRPRNKVDEKEGGGVVIVGKVMKGGPRDGNGFEKWIHGYLDMALHPSPTPIPPSYLSLPLFLSLPNPLFLYLSTNTIAFQICFSPPYLKKEGEGKRENSKAK